MILLDTTELALGISLASAVSSKELTYTCSWENDPGITYNSSDGTTRGLTLVTVIQQPPINTKRKLLFLSIVNTDSANNTVYVELITGTSSTGSEFVTKNLFQALLKPGYSVIYDTEAGFKVFDNTGSEIISAPTGVVTSVGLADGSTTPVYLITGSPVLGAGTLTFTFKTQTANTVLAGPSAGGASQPTFRSLVVADIPALPYISNVLTNTHILVGNAGNIATDVGVSGDVSLSNTGLVTIATHAVTYAKMQQASTVTLLGNPTGGLANIQEITLGAGLSFSGSTLVSTGSGGTVTTVSVVTNQGVSGSVSNPATTPAITLTLGALTGVTSYNGLIVTANTGVITTGTWNGSVVDLAYGGTNANLTASNGGIVWSNATKLQILSGTATANQILTSGSTAAPTWQNITNFLTAGTGITFSGTTNVTINSSFGGFANPTASLGLTAINGVATTAMRSDAAPALDVTITPTWTGEHIWNLNAPAVLIGSTTNIVWTKKFLACIDVKNSTATLDGLFINNSNNAGTIPMALLLGFGGSGTVFGGTNTYCGGIGFVTATNNFVTGSAANDIVIGQFGVGSGVGSLVFAAAKTKVGKWDSSGRLGINQNPSASAYLSIVAGTTTIAPLQLTSGTNLTTPVGGSIEYDASFFYGSIVSTRYEFVMDTLAQTLTNKRITKRVVSMADATSCTPTGDTADINTQTNTQAIGTLTVNSPSGTPTDGQELFLRFKCTNVQTFAWNAIFAGCTTTALPTSSTGAGKTDLFFFIYNATASKWQIYNAEYGYA